RRGSLQEQWDLALYLHEAAVGAACAAGILEDALLHDLGAEAPGSAADRIRKKLIGLMGAANPQPSHPPLAHNTWGETVGQHGSRRRRMDGVGTAVFLPQPVVDRPGIKEDEAAPASSLGGLEQHIG